MTGLQRAAAVGAVATMLASLVDTLVRRSWPVAVAGFGLALLIGLSPRLILAVASAARQRARQALWADEEGRHHSFAGVALRIVHDAHHSWIDGADLQRVLGTRDREDVLAARLAGAWRRDEHGALMLRLDRVVAHLASMPGRMDPRVVRLRRYFEREVLHPAGQRRARR